MVKIAMYRENDKQPKRLLVIWRTPKGNLVGEDYWDGKEKRGQWVQRATFEGRDAQVFRVLEYFGYKNEHLWWERWP